MLFNSIAFALFLPIVFGLYWGVFSKHKMWRNAFILVVSYIFYGWWDWRFLTLIFISSLSDFLIARGIEHFKVKTTRQILLTTSLVINVGLLGFFKYFGFFTDSLVIVLNNFGMEISPFTLNILLPVGISFYTFQTVGYVVDVYQGKVKASKDPIAFFAYVSFFPQLVAGPIERAKRLLPQFQSEKRFSYPDAVEGLRWILWGFFKKLVVADQLAVYVHDVFKSPRDFSGPELVAATMFFGIQVYCDFSGYSAIAIGTARLFGFDLMVNFRTPFFSASIKEFWTRWHISLSTWFRDYVYIPMGGSRQGYIVWAVGIIVTFLVSGLWHGAAITYVSFGLYHGVMYVIEQSIGKALKGKFTMPRWIGWILTFCFVNVGWLFFRALKINDVWLILKQSVLGWQPIFQGVESLLDTVKDIPGFHRLSWFILPSIAILFTIEIFMGKETISTLFSKIPRPGRWALAYFLVIWILLFGAFNLKQSFVYFQF